MSANYDKLKEKLKEIFQLDQADLDFGIYRIMNTKRDEIMRYLDADLKPQVKAILETLEGDSKGALEGDLQKAIEGAKAAGFKPDEAPKVIEIREKMKGSVDIDALEKEIFSDLYNFFSRYYEGGDFLSLRRYKEGVYAIPYEGEEVKLHWANSDQYYIKTSEYFTNYSFKLSDGKRVHFRLTKAGTEANNNKAQEGKDRRFIVSTTEKVTVENDELVIPFEYKPDNDKRAQKVINEANVQALREDKAVTSFAPDLFKEIERASGGNWTVLEKHLNDYTAKNEFDYFIHKDLGGFMRRELDFFIKNEILYLDDMIDQTPKDFEKRLAKLKALKTIGHKIIAFLAQLEEFQKKLWLKKKFVVETNWCITLDRVPEELYADIAANDAQRDEWVKLFAIDYLDGYAKKLTVQFLKDNPYLVLDTAFFTDDFKAKLLSSIENIDEQTDGLLVHSDNFQALNVLNNKYEGSLSSIYIDPPYNTDASAIIYKNNYKSSSWLTLMDNRLNISSPLLKEEGVICVAIDDEEVSGIRYVLDSLFHKQVGIAPVRSNPAGRKTKGTLAPAHEYALFYGKTSEAVPDSLDLNEKRLARYPHEDDNGRYSWANFIRSGTNDRRADRPKSFYPIYVDKNDDIRIPKMQWNESKREYDILEECKSGEIAVYPIVKNGNGVIEKRWQRGHVRVPKELHEYRVRRLPNGEVSIDFKTRMDEGSLPTTWWENKEYASANYGALELKELFGEKPFDFSKSRRLVEDCLKVSGLKSDNAIVLDYFSGSGTTGHAVINLNREDDGSRKYLLVEMGEYFDAVTKPRIQKVIYSKDWKDGKPLSREGISHCFKYIRLESYEDALNNLTLKRADAAQGVLDENEKIREQYLLHYMLDTESKGSVLDLDAFANPFNYQLMINRGDDTRARKIDLVETFNYLIGLYVEQMRFIDDVYVVNGKTREGEAILTLWRDAEKLDAAKLDKWFEDNRKTLNPSAYSTIYVNGDNTLQGQAGKGDNWNVKMIEEAFHRLMFNETSL